MSSTTMLMFKPDCLAGFSHCGREVGFGEVLGQVMELGSAATEWRMEMGARLCLTPVMAGMLYAVHKGKPFHDGLLDSVTSGPVFVSIWSGDTDTAWQVGRSVVEAVRKSYGRDDLSKTGPSNVLHASDGPDSAAEEVRWAIRTMTLRCAASAGGEEARCG